MSDQPLDDDEEDDDLFLRRPYIPYGITPRILSIEVRDVDAFEQTDEDGGRYISEEVKDYVWRRDRGLCARCGSWKKLHFDHIIPVSKGGDNSKQNVQLLCQKCNLSKGHRIG